MITDETADRIWHGTGTTILLERTCFACPEQYDAWTPEGRKVGYLRLRHGYFIACVPNSGGVEIYLAEPKGDGIFEDEDERDRYLDEACEAIAVWISANA